MQDDSFLITALEFAMIVAAFGMFLVAYIGARGPLF
jgi:hypothetical protein